MLNYEKINLNFNGETIFKDFSLHVKGGEKISLISPSGAGKSTLMEMTLGFVKPDSGLIKVDNELVDRSNIENIRKKISWLPQNPEIINSGNVRQVIMSQFNYQANKHLKPDESTLQKYLEMINLSGDILDSDYEELSGGEKQRIGLLICRLMDRKIMLLDEPTSALDSDAKGKVIQMLFGQKELTVLSASHDDLWLDSCDKIIEISNGRN